MLPFPYLLATTLRQIYKQAHGLRTQCHQQAPFTTRKHYMEHTFQASREQGELRTSDDGSASEPSTSTSASSSRPHSTTRNQQQAFMFVDSAVARERSNEAIRVHVMRERHRARRVAQRQPEAEVIGQVHLWNSTMTASEGSSSAARNEYLGALGEAATELHQQVITSGVNVSGAQTRASSRKDASQQAYEDTYLIEYCTRTRCLKHPLLLWQTS